MVLWPGVLNVEFQDTKGEVQETQAAAPQPGARAGEKEGEGEAKLAENRFWLGSLETWGWWSGFAKTRGTIQKERMQIIPVVYIYMVIWCCLVGEKSEMPA